MSYFNFDGRIGEGPGAWRPFVPRWWSLYAADRRWTPPPYGLLRWALHPGRNPHLARLEPIYLTLEARRRDEPAGPYGPASLSQVFEEQVAAAVLLRDPRRPDGTAYLGLLHTVNDGESLEQLLGMAAEAIAAEGYHRLVGPTGLSPHLESGLLHDYWAEWPPLHTPYNPPYVPELLAGEMEPFLDSRLYEMTIAAGESDANPGPAVLEPLPVQRLAGEWLPLLAAACSPWLEFPPPDELEAAFLLRWLGRWPLSGWVAKVGGEAVGFVLLQPDMAPLLRLARGGRSWWRRPLLALGGRWRARQGRLLLGGVLPAWRGRGIGRQLWQQALATGRQAGWQKLIIGPLPETAGACNYLAQSGAIARQRYGLYRRDA